jgi:hypothetical protein
MKSSAGMGGATSLSLMRWRQRAHQYDLVHDLDLQSGSEESIGDWLQQQTQTARTARIIKTREAWVAQVKTLYPGYNGTYPRMQLWHETTDSFVFYTGS